jgi:hypothetical protein
LPVRNTGVGLFFITIGPVSGKIMSTSLSIDCMGLVDCTASFYLLGAPQREPVEMGRRELVSPMHPLFFSKLLTRKSSQLIRHGVV